MLNYMYHVVLEYFSILGHTNLNNKTTHGQLNVPKQIQNVKCLFVNVSLAQAIR